jgi:hypothetical protein
MRSRRCTGEDGLRERLLIEVGRFPAAERDRNEAALALMLRLHERDRRQREPVQLTRRW